MFFASLFLFSSITEAGIVIGGTRVIYDGNKPDVSLSIYNKEESLPYLIQVWLEPFNKSDKSKPPFTAIPPVSRLEPQQEKRLRIIKTRGSLPADRESVFWLNIKNIPPASGNENSSALEIAIKTRIKLFWRPATIKFIPESAAPRVKWRRQGNNLLVENPTPIHVNVMSVTIDGKDVPLNMLPPFETVTLPLPAGITGNTLVWRFINDYGAISDDLKQTF